MPAEKGPLQRYHEYVQNKFRRSWKPAASGRPVHVVFFVEADGTITDVSLRDGSGNRELDDAALGFVRAQKLKPLPAELAEKLGRIQFDHLF